MDRGYPVGKSKNGVVGGMTPDWLDVEAAIRAIDGIHSGTTMVTILADGIGATGGLKIAVSTHWEMVPGAAGISEVITERVTLERGCEALPAFVLGGLYAHDFAIGSAYQQAKMGL